MSEAICGFGGERDCGQGRLAVESRSGKRSFWGYPPSPRDLLESWGYGHTTLKIFEE